MIVNLGYLYLVLWLLICSLSLSKFEFNGYYSDVYVMTLSSVCASTLTFSSFCGFKRSIFSPVNILPSVKVSSLLDSKKFLQYIFLVYIIAVFVEAAFAGGFPLLSLFGLSRQMSYVNFGIPGVHGIVNSFGYTACIVSLYQCLKYSLIDYRSHFARFVLVVIALIFVLQLHRAVMVASILQSLALLLLFRRKTASVPWLFALLSLSAVVFGLLGDLRSGREHFLQLAGFLDYPDFLPSGFAWIYIYLVTPFANTLSNSEYLVRLDHLNLPFETLQSSIPSFIRPASLLDLSLETEAWNVHSLFSPLLADYGYFAFLPSVFIGVVWALCFVLAKKNQKFWPLYSVAFMQVLLTCFGSLSFHISFLFEMMILFLASVVRQDFLRE